MLSLQDCLDLADVSDSEVVAICRHEHIPPIVALQLGQRLIQTAGGVEKLRQFILDDIMNAEQQGRCRDCEQFSRTLADYNEKHPERRKIALSQDGSLRELLAIGQVQELLQVSEGLDERRTIALREVQEARDVHDCCACRHLSLGHLHLLDSLGDVVAPGKS
jgi:hypothetical protein